jgi:hypothetical protein
MRCEGTPFTSPSKGEVDPEDRVGVGGGLPRHGRDKPDHDVEVCSAHPDI